jgi:chromosome partitioning protein
MNAIAEELYTMTGIFALTNHKGGVGKSTSATTLALGLVAVLRNAGVKNHRVLLIDTDSQGHATLVTTGRKDYGQHDSLHTVLVAERQNSYQILLNCCVPSQWHPNLFVLPASQLLDNTERELLNTSGAPYRLSKALEPISHYFNAIVIDTRPSFSLMTVMALLSATDAIIPVEPRYLETTGMLSAMNQIVEIRDGWERPNLRIKGILVTKMDKRIKGHLDSLQSLQEHQALGKLLYGVIPANEAVSYAHRNHQSLFAYDPRASASKAYVQVVASLVRYLSKGGE